MERLSGIYEPKNVLNRRSTSKVRAASAGAGAGRGVEHDFSESVGRDDRRGEGRASEEAGGDGQGAEPEDHGPVTAALAEIEAGEVALQAEKALAQERRQQEKREREQQEKQEREARQRREEAEDRGPEIGD